MKPPGTLPWLFRRGGTDRALIALAVNGPLTVRELARAAKSDSHKMWDIVERLRQCSLVVKRDVPGGRKYVSLNRDLPIYRALLKLLLALDRQWPAQRSGRYIARWNMPFDPCMSTTSLDNIFQSPTRSRMLLFVAAAGEVDLSTAYTLLGLNSASAWHAANHWEKQGVVRSRRYKRHRLLSLDPNFIVAKELQALLRAVVATSDEYAALRTAARRSLRPILMAVGSNVATPKRRPRLTQ